METCIVKNDLLKINVQQISQQASWQVARLGSVGKIGVGLFAAAIVFFLAAVLPQNSTVSELKERADTMQVQVSAQNGTGPERRIGGDQALQIFYDFFPRIDSSPFWVRELVRIAKKNGVEMNSSDYRLVHENNARLARYEMILPIRGRYPQIRSFIADSLQDIPSLAIAGMVVKRENVQTEQLDVRLEINLFLDE